MNSPYDVDRERCRIMDYIRLVVNELLDGETEFTLLSFINAVYDYSIWYFKGSNIPGNISCLLLLSNKREFKMMTHLLYKLHCAAQVEGTKPSEYKVAIHNLFTSKEFNYLLGILFRGELRCLPILMENYGRYLV
jgi:hypothetical protein